MFFKRKKQPQFEEEEAFKSNAANGHQTSQMMRSLLHQVQTSPVNPQNFVMPVPTGLPAAPQKSVPSENPTPAANIPSTAALPSESKTPHISIHKEVLESALGNIDGATGVAIVEYNSGTMLGSAGGDLNLELAAAGNTDVVKAKMHTMQSLGISGSIEDILITLDSHYHIIYLVPGQTLFLYLVLQKDRANLALARYKLKALGSELKI